ncbi:putative ABC transporter ATP-binding protein YbiT [Clostridiales bacterium]|nr:putative ABC transporter ATP-binding protein YbiT [Clostridiales bacterium]
MSLINVSNLTFSYEGSSENVFNNISFQIDTDWRLGFAGRNGRGKTTFLKLLMGEYTYSGTISASVKFEYFPYCVKDKSKNTIDIFYEICPLNEDWELFRELTLLEVNLDVLYRPFSSMSNGEQVKSLLAMLFLVSNSFLLIDEPTNHLDDRARTVIGQYLQRKKGFILVSHDRSLLDLCTDHTLSINKANIEIQRGNFSSWLANKTLQDKFELSENKKLKREISKLSDASKRTASWSAKTEKEKHRSVPGEKIDRGFVGHKAAKTMKRSKAIEARQEKAITEKTKLLHNLEVYDPLAIHPLAFHKQRLVSADGLSLFYGDKVVCNNISFEISAGDRIALCGKNGSGKSSMLKLLCGESIKYTGNISIASGLKISYVPQSTDYLEELLSELTENSGIDESLFKAILRKMDFSREQFSKNVADFSEGQKKKVLLAKSLCEKAHLYVWDEPLNFIDIFSRIQIENVLLEYKPTIIFVEHDASFKEKVATKIVEI